MVFIKVGSITNVPVNTMRGVLAEGKEVLVANINGKIYAIGNTCTHMGCKISGGTLHIREGNHRAKVLCVRAMDLSSI